MPSDPTQARTEELLLDLRKKVAEGIRAANRGDLSDGDEFFDELAREEAADAKNDDGPS